MANNTILEIRDLSISFRTHAGMVNLTYRNLQGPFGYPRGCPGIFTEMARFCRGK